MRFLRLARALVPRREWPAILGVALLVGLVCGFAWTRAPATGPHGRISARVTGTAYIPYSKWTREPARIEVELADGQRDTVWGPFTQLRECKVGDTITVARIATNSGLSELRIEPGACDQPSARSPR